ncbi:MAG: hypothetical protein GX144_12625 [Clostridiaceae bacterium]|nr:hypothetical protein [Clostridiaceae bacterium]
MHIDNINIACYNANYSIFVNVYYAAIYQTQYMATGNAIIAASIAYLLTATVFADKVKIGGDWDLKQDLGWNQYYDTEIDGDTYYLSGEDIGNIHYGFVDSTLFSPLVLKAAAGLVQIVGGEYRIEWYSTYFDDPNDQIAIQRGIDYFNNGEFE